ncbi:MAG TPA: oligosaccharide flippase family protein [Burkholderiaceae bacterium]|nr:oligosaccharide flippase family protein [Burkholderiaceae bacterium]
MTSTAPASAGGSGARLVANSRWNLIAFACTLAANLITVPFVVRWIGVAEFGRAGIVLAVTAPLTLIGSVLGQAVTREVSARLANSDASGAAECFGAALRLCAVVGVIAAAALITAGPWLTAGLLGEQHGATDLLALFALAACGWFGQQLTLVFQGNQMAHQDFRTVARMAMISAVLTVIATLALTAALPTAIGYLAGVAAAFGSTLVGWFWTARHDPPRLTIAGPSHARALLRFGKWQGVAQLAGALSNQVDRYALGAFATTSAVGQFNIANRLQEAVYIGVVKAGEVLFPHFGRIAGRPAAEQAAEFHAASWVVGVFSAAALAPMIPLAASILDLWIGPQAGGDAPTLLRTLIFGGIVGCGSNVFTYYAMGTGRIRPLAWISVMYSVITVVLSIALIRVYGAAAAGVGLLVASFFRVAAALIVARRDFFPDAHLEELLVGAVLPVAAGTAVAWLLYAAGMGAASWPSLAAQYAAGASAVVIVACGASSFAPSGRQIMRSAVAAIRRRAPG